MSKQKKNAPIELPRKGGSYVANASTGKLERKAHTKPAEPRGGDAPASDTPEKKEG